MLIKVVVFFLVGMAVLAMFGRLRFPGQRRLQAAKCADCGRFRLGRRAPCPCGKGGA